MLCVRLISSLVELSGGAWLLVNHAAVRSGCVLMCPGDFIPLR